MNKFIAWLLLAALVASPAHAQKLSQLPTGGTVNSSIDQLIAVRSGTSATSNTIATGSQTFTTQSGLGFVSGQLVTIANGANTMAGAITSYSGTTLVINATSVSGSGTFSSWTIYADFQVTPTPPSAYLQPANNLSDLGSASTARTNLGLGSAATQAIASFLQPSNNLSDVASASTARTNLGLGSAATQAIAAFLQPSNNLSDLTSASTARTNLGLGTAATQPATSFAQSISITTPTLLYTSPINFTNTSGAFTGSLALLTQNANTVLAGPTTGAAAAPTMRALIAADIPDLSATYLKGSNNLSDVASASTARTNLGLGTASTQAINAFLQPSNNLSDLLSLSTALNNILPSQGGNSGKVLGTNGTVASWVTGGGSVSVTAATPDLVITPSPGTGTFTVGTAALINAQGTAASYTILASDISKTVTHNKTTAVAVSLPQAGTTGFAAGTSYTEINLGAGAVTITPTTSTINGAASLVLNQNQAAWIISDGTNYVAFLGSSGGSSVSVTAGSPNILVNPSPGTGTFTVGAVELINAQGAAASYTVLTSDMGKTVTHNKSTAVAETLPSATTSGFGAGSAYTEFNLGAGVVTITPTTSTINGSATFTLSQNQGVFIISDGTNYIGLPLSSGSGSGTVTTASVVSANGFAGTVANPTTTPAITLSTSVTGLLKGNGTAIAGATSGTDYQAPITLTTTGTSGASTFVGNTLNIPQYSGGGGSVSVTAATPNIVINPTPGTGTFTVGATQLIDAQGTATSYTVLSSDMGKTVSHNASTAVAESLPAASTTGFGTGASYTEQNLGTGVVTITPTTSTINGLSSLILNQYESAYITSDGTNYIAFVSKIPSQFLSFQTGPINAATTGKAAFAKVTKSSKVDNIEGSALTLTCTVNPTITMYECGTSTTCATPTTIGSATVTAAGTVVDGTVSNPTITAGDYVAWAITAGTCTALNIAGTAQMHAN